MTIGVDATSSLSHQPTGRQWFARHLVRSLIPLLGRDHHHDVQLFLDEEESIKLELPFNVRKKTLHLRRFPRAWRLNFEMFFRSPDIYFSPVADIPFFRGKKNIVCLFDLDVLHAGEFSRDLSFFQRILFFFKQRKERKSLQRVIRRSSLLITPSESIKEELIRSFHCPEKKLAVIPPGGPDVPPLLHWTAEEVEEKKKSFFLEPKELFILFVGTLESKKNLIRLLEAFRRFLGEFPDWKLVFAGKRGNGFESFWKKVVEMKMEQHILVPGYVTEEEKQFLYAHCRFVVYPSLYQGFGFPILEAFAFRRPVMTSRSHGMQEVAKDAAFLVNPEKVEEISIGLKRLASDGVLASRCIQKGALRLEQFSWERCAEKTFETILSVSMK